MKENEWDKYGRNIKTQSMYDENGFDRKGKHKDTGIRFGPDGYDRNGRDSEGYDREGYDKKNFNREGINKYTGNKYNRQGVDKDGYNEKGFNQSNGINRSTGTKFDEDGYDIRGYDKDGFKKDGFNKSGKHKDTGTIFGLDGYDRNGFNADGIHKDTGTQFNSDGYDKDGYDRDGFHRRGRNKEGYDREGYDRNGYDKNGYDKDGYDEKNYDRDGFNRNGFNVDGMHKDTGTQFDLDGYNKEGYNKDGYNKYGLDKTGKNREERKKIQEKQRKNWLGLRDKAEKLGKGQISIEEYIMKSKTSLDDLIVFAKKEHLSPDIIRGLYKYKSVYKTYTRPFKKKEYLETTLLIINGEEIRPTEQEVDSCIEYLKANSIIICDKTVKATISQYKRGEIDITQRMEEVVEESTKTQLEILEKEQNTKFIKKSLDNAKRIIMGKDENGKDKTYLDMMLNQRIEGPSNAGSSYRVNSPEELYEKLINQEWEETTHPDVMPGCRVFKSNLEGLEGILNLDKLPDDVELYAIDPKETGRIGMGAGKVEKNLVEETYIIVGKENIDGKDEDVVFTFHPGEPVRPSEVETKDIPDGTRLSKEEAKGLGFDKVKYLSEEMLEQYIHKNKAMKLEKSKEESEKLSSELKELEKENQKMNGEK